MELAWKMGDQDLAETLPVCCHWAPTTSLGTGNYSSHSTITVQHRIATQQVKNPIYFSVLQKKKSHASVPWVGVLQSLLELWFSPIFRFRHSQFHHSRSTKKPRDHTKGRNSKIIDPKMWFPGCVIILNRNESSDMHAQVLSSHQSLSIYLSDKTLSLKHKRERLLFLTFFG